MGYDGDWWFSSNANFNEADLLAGGQHFSADNGLWGANDGIVDGNGLGNILWGQGVYDSTDANDCSNIYHVQGVEYLNGNTQAVVTVDPTVRSYFYFR